MTTIRKKLIEISIPLEEINKASAREKSIRHGHPSTLHLWWARRPLAACRAVLFAQLVDDPSSWPGRYPFPEIANDEDAERRRLHKVIARMVPWEASNDEDILNEARWEIARSVAWGLGEEPPAPDDGNAILDYLQTKAPPVYDPFSGGGSIPLEAQRLGLRAYGSDLNPVAVLIGKALVEIPPKFAGLSPVNPDAQKELAHGHWNGKGAQGLAEDMRYYGKWIRDEAEKRIGHLYPKGKLPDGSEATVIAWLWARTVRSPDPAAKGAMVPLVSTWILSSKASRQSWARIIADPSADQGYRFEVESGKLNAEQLTSLKNGTKAGRGSSFICALTGAAIDGEYIKSEGQAGRLGKRLLAVVIEGNRERIYLPPSKNFLIGSDVSAADDIADTPASTHPQYMGCAAYGLDNFRKMYTDRQLVTLATLCELVNEARDKIVNSGREGDRNSEYADAIATYLAFAVSKLADRGSTICTWFTERDSTRPTFARQAIQMTWDFAELNMLLAGSGSFLGAVEWTAEALAEQGLHGKVGSINQINAAQNGFPVRPVVFSTDPPYYDNIPYADLSDYFYVWFRRSLLSVWPSLFRRLSVPKQDELVADVKRHGGKQAAERFFMQGMSSALSAMYGATTEFEPITIYYAFKQSELAAEGITSAGWSSFLQAIIDSGFSIDGTWPVRTELSNRMRGLSSNALASSVVLVCRKRPADAPIINRGEFLRLLKRELPDAIDDIRKAGVGPVDMQQSVIGPGMGVFSRHAKILEDDDSAMSVKTALALINRVWEEIENELDATFDAETQVALVWYGSYGFDPRPSGDLIMLCTAKNTSDRALFHSEVFEDRKGKAALTAREKLPADWNPAKDSHLTVWECVQHVARTLRADDGGEDDAARLVAGMGPKSADARKLAYRLFEIATQKGWSAEALVYNELAEIWPKLEDKAANIETLAPKGAPRERDLFDLGA